MEPLIAIIQKVRERVIPASDMGCVSGYDGDAAKLAFELDQYIRQLRAGDYRCLEQLSMYFSPASVFQDHSIANGWGHEYLLLANEFDDLYEQYKRKR